MGLTTIKKIHCLIPPATGGGEVARVRNVAATDVSGFGDERHFTGIQDISVDWNIPWAWEERHFTFEHQHIDVIINGRPEIFSIWQQDDNIFRTADGTFTGTRTRIGDINGERRLVILPDSVMIIGMFDPLPTIPPAIGTGCIIHVAPYSVFRSGGDSPSADSPDLTVLTTGSFTIRNSGWVARSHVMEAGFGKFITAPTFPGRAIQVQTTWDLNPTMVANGFGYAKAQLFLRLEVHPQDKSSGQFRQPLIQEQLMWYNQVYFGFSQPSGHFSGVTPTISLTFTPGASSENFLMKAFLKSFVGGFGWINAEASCFGSMQGFEVCRL